MANVDQATRILNMVSSDDYCRLDETKKLKIVDEFFCLPNENKPISFRKCSKNDLKAFFSSLNSSLKKLITNAYKRTVIKLSEDVNNNKVGSDLIAFFDDDSQRIELKFGSETNANIGNKTMDLVFGLTNHNPSFSSLCLDLREKQYDFVVEKKNGECALSYKNLEHLVEELTKKVTILNDKRYICVNNTQIKRMLEASGSLNNFDLVGENQIKIFVSYKKNISSSFKVAERLNLDGEWKVISIKKAEGSIRTEIMVSNSSCKAKFLLNWKNNYKDKKNNKKYSAKLGVGSSNWNVWLFKC